MRKLFLCTLLFACSEKVDDTGEETETDDSGEVVQPDDTEGETDPEEEADTVKISGTAVWGDGAPADGATIQVCAALCRRTNVGADGSWGVEGLEKEKYIVLGFSSSDASIATTVTLIDMQEDRDLDPMVLHPYATSEAWGTSTQDYALDAGLTLSFNGADMSMGLYAVTTTSNISSLRIDEADLPIDFSKGTIHGIWMLGEFDHQPEDGSEEGISWSMSDPATNLGLEVGTDVEVYVLDNAAHAWSSLGTFAISEDGIDGGDTKLPALSTLVVSTP